jgi:hypothetical protein
MIRIALVMKKLLATIVMLFTLCQVGIFAQDDMFFTDKGSISFASDAPLEVIKAASEKLAGIINLGDRTFTFSIPMNSFNGFNSALQRTHFNENYLESEKYPKSTFNGKIIEETDFTVPGEYRIRAKGKFNIHGIEMDRIIRSTLTVRNNEIFVKSEFTVLLEDHDIKIPSIVQQKLAEEISVIVEATFSPMK